jgi:hypothetical protein
LASSSVAGSTLGGAAHTAPALNPNPATAAKIAARMFISRKMSRFYMG